MCVCACAGALIAALASCRDRILLHSTSAGEIQMSSERDSAPPHVGHKGRKGYAVEYRL